MHSNLFYISCLINSNLKCFVYIFTGKGFKPENSERYLSSFYFPLKVSTIIRFTDLKIFTIQQEMQLFKYTVKTYLK